MGRRKKPKPRTEAQEFQEAAAALQVVVEMSAGHDDPIVAETSLATGAQACLPVGVEHARPQRLVVVEADDPIWSASTLSSGRFDGALVQVQPPDDCSLDLIETIDACLRGAGAQRVNVLPCRRTRAVVDPREGNQGGEPTTLRQVVERMIDDGPPGEEREAMRAFCRPIMDRVGM